MLTAKNGGRVFALSYMKLSDTEPVFEEIHISSFMETTLVSISIPQLNYKNVISLQSSNNWQFSTNFMQDISVPVTVSVASYIILLVYTRVQRSSFKFTS